MDVHKGDGGQAHVDACGKGEGSKTRFSCGRHKCGRGREMDIDEWIIEQRKRKRSHMCPAPLGLCIVLGFIVGLIYKRFKHNRPK